MLSFYSEQLLALHPTTKLEDHPLIAVQDCSCCPYLEAVLSIRTGVHPKEGLPGCNHPNKKKFVDMLTSNV
jgi:hypothetical protein